MTDTAQRTLLDYLAHTDVVHIATRTRDGREIVTPIWGVVANDAGYIRNGYGPSSKWYRRAMRNGGVAFAAGDERIPVMLERADSSELDAVDDAYRAKYSGFGLEDAVTEPVRSDTLRATPA